MNTPGNEGAARPGDADVGHSAPPLPARYRPLAEIARGGMGAVWRVVDRQFDRPLAVKIMLPQLVGNRAAFARFEREERAAAEARAVEEKSSPVSSVLGAASRWPWQLRC